MLQVGETTLVILADLATRAIQTVVATGERLDHVGSDHHQMLGESVHEMSFLRRLERCTDVILGL